MSGITLAPAKLSLMITKQVQPCGTLHGHVICSTMPLKLDDKLRSHVCHVDKMHVMQANKFLLAVVTYTISE